MVDEPAADVDVRAISSHEDFQAAVELQHLTWGPGYTDVVPASLLMVSQKVGSLVAGAFAPDGRLLGFVYGLTGVKRGRTVHWSHMLAVREDARNRGIGRLLKRFQAGWLGERGVEEMQWTFDPLVARNAHLNLNLLGVEVREYVPHMYAHTGSRLHDFGTDRFIVSWQLRSDGAAPNATPAHAQGTAESLPAAFPAPPRQESPRAEGPLPEAPRVRLFIPADVETLAGAQRRNALAWRRSTRSAFLHYQERGYRVTGFCRHPEAPFYVLQAPSPGA